MLSGNVPFNRGKLNDLQYEILNCPLKDINDVSFEANDFYQDLYLKFLLIRFTPDDI